MRPGPVILSAVGIVTLTATAAGLRAQSGATSPGYLLATVDRGSVASLVRASGTLSPEMQVAVSPAAVGVLQALFVEDNSEVNAGTMLGRLDATQANAHLQAAKSELTVAQRGVDIVRSQLDRARLGITSAEAGRAAAVAEVAHANDVLDGAQRNLERQRSLARTGDAARVELERAQTAHEQAETDVGAAQARLTAAETSVAAARSDVQVVDAQLQNALAVVAAREAAVHDDDLEVDHTSIRAPIGGVILDHTAVVGQMVSGAPGLFTIASDLRRMRLHASVDEADIGNVRVGQPATFTVDSFPGETFHGEVLLVKRSPQASQNVVTYDVNIAAANPDQKLLPGMTATVEIITGEERDTLRVPSAALRFDPGGDGGAMGTTVWTVAADEQLVPHHVDAGRSNGALTAIRAADLSPGDGVVVAVAAPDPTKRGHSLFGL